MLGAVCPAADADEPDELTKAIEARVFVPTAPYPVVEGVPL